MVTECNSKQLHFQGLGSRKVVADFDGSTITSDAGALLLREIEAANHFFDDFASCFVPAAENESRDRRPTRLANRYPVETRYPPR